MPLAAGDGHVRAQQLGGLEQPHLRRLTSRLARFVAVDVGRRAGGERVGQLRQHAIGRDRGREVVAVRLQVDLAGRGEDADRPHPVLRQRAGLVRADHRRGAERLDRAQPLHECAPAGEAGDSHREGEGDRRQQPLGHVRDDQAHGERRRIVQRQAGGEPPERQERHPDRDRDSGDQPRHAPHLALDRARLLAHALRQRRDPPELGVHAGGVDERAGLPADAGRAAEHEPAGLDGRAAGLVLGIGRAVDGLRLAGERREIDLDPATEEACVGGDPVAFADDHDVAGHERGRVDDADVAVANDGRLLWEIALERLDSPARLSLLGEGEDRVEQDHRDDRRAEHRRARDEGETGCDPEQQGQRVDQLVEDLARPLAAPAAA